MKKSFLKSILALAFLLFSFESFAQNTHTKKSSFSESNLPDKTLAKTTIEKLNSLQQPLENSALIDKIQGGMANLLLGNKATSLMFDDKESDNIDRAVDSLKSNQVYVPEDGSDGTIDPSLDQKKKDEEETKEKEKQSEFNEKSYIYLASIMYYTPKEWVVWINDKKITSETNKDTKELYLKSVEKDQISVLWSVSATKLKVLLGKKADDLNLKMNENNQIEVRFILKPNQTFILGSNSVVEGKVTTAQTKKKETKTEKVIKEKSSQSSGGLGDLLKAFKPN